jgi:hypothetical protein
LSLNCELAHVLDLTGEKFLAELGTTLEELTRVTPSRFILNARGEETPTQTLGAACSFCGAVSALKVPSAANRDGYCLNILPDSLLVGEHITILDDTDRLRGRIEGVIPVPSRGQ